MTAGCAGIRAAQDLKSAIQALHEFGFAERGKDFELPEIIPLKG